MRDIIAQEDPVRLSLQDDLIHDRRAPGPHPDDFKPKRTPRETLPAPHVPGNTEFERFDNAMRRALTVSKEELLRREAEEKRQREHKPKRRSKP